MIIQVNFNAFLALRYFLTFLKIEPTGLYNIKIYIQSMYLELKSKFHYNFNSLNHKATSSFPRGKFYNEKQKQTTAREWNLHKFFTTIELVVDFHKFG